MNDDDELLARLGDAMTTSVPDPSPDRIAAVREAALRAQTARVEHSGPSSTAETNTQATAGSTLMSGRRTWLLSAAAAAVGVVGGAAAVMVSNDDAAPSAAPGPPTEAVQFTPSAESGTALSGKVINHTWGVELLLDATGFAVGSRYRVVYLDTTDATLEAGGFIGAAIPIHCRCNAALLRNDIAAIEIRDADDSVVSRADFT